ncbi:MAG: hypothetical protein ACLFNQ_01345 [Spirochaetaceae bacterium]
MRTIVSAVFLSIVCVGVIAFTTGHDEDLDPLLYDYVSENFYEDTASRNAVASVLLNYRMYDTIFEALILLTAIVGMMQFLPGVEGDIGIDQEDEEHE